MPETSGIIGPSEKRAQTELHSPVMMRFKSRFEMKAPTLAGSRMVFHPVVNKIPRPFRRELFEGLQPPGFDKLFQKIQVF
jgi:hypothetical protein